jgi:flagellar basal-body rod protein FlgB
LIEIDRGRTPMFTNLSVFTYSFAMASHAGARQALIAQNMANADTPGFQPRDLQPFRSHFADMKEPGGNSRSRGLVAFRPGHLHGHSPSSAHWSEQNDAQTPTDPNKNGVSVEEEMLKAVETRRQHDRALAIYKSSLSVLRSSLGRP